MPTPKGNEHFGLLEDMIARMKQGPDCWSAKELAEALITEKGSDYFKQYKYLSGEDPVSVVRSYLSTNKDRFQSTRGVDGAEYCLRGLPWK